jgi:hypothetical protein
MNKKRFLAQNNEHQSIRASEHQSIRASEHQSIRGKLLFTILAVVLMSIFKINSLSADIPVPEKFIEIVDISSNLVYSEKAVAISNKLNISLPIMLSNGTYFIRAYDTNNKDLLYKDNFLINK